MAIKKYSSGQWGDTPYRKYGTETDTITTLPKTIIGDGTAISSYTIKGAMSRSGTPTPTNPIYPQECGDKTANLYDLSSAIDTEYYINTVGRLVIGANDDMFMALRIAVTPDATYTFSWGQTVMGAENNSPYIRVAEYNNNVFLRQVAYNCSDYPNNIVTITVSPNTTSIDIRYDSASSARGQTITNLMLNTGSTALSYEPYGYKIPILCGDVTTPVFLGDVQSTRKIGKLVLTGKEDWGAPTETLTHRFSLNTGKSLIASDGLSSHYMFNFKSDNTYTHYYINSQGYLYLFDLDYTSVADFKAYLANQYAAGTPVIVWYVLSTATTGVANEPIRKIGDYADSVTGTGLSTTGTAETFDVDTTLKPSEVQLTYHGWHDQPDEEYSGGSWT